MRLDKYLKTARILKRREAAKDFTKAYQSKWKNRKTQY